MKKIFPALLLCASCSTLQNGSSRGAGDSHNLTESEAKLRSNSISSVTYDLYFDLTERTEFKGTSQISFRSLKPLSALRVDFTGGTVHGVAVNNSAANFEYDGNAIRIDSGSFNSKVDNTIKIEFSHPYSHDGEGLHQFVDPEDQKIYLYSNLEPYDANKIFPCFDQPDLKASYSMKVDALSDWIVVGPDKETRVTTLDNRETTSRWEFAKSEVFSTYIWSLIAGNYKVIDGGGKRIPLRLLVRQSLSKYVDSNAWFRWTRSGFQFFENYFGVKYPYSKYDQIIVPEFPSGAMENVGSVTFNESFVKRGKSTRTENLRLASVILHEMAHMWFGNLVTMRWWDGLWLNESFATYMAYVALHEATEFKEAWVNFFREKRWAYWEDQLITNHPINGVVAVTQSAFASFDGITYGKGAAWLQQVNRYIGKEAFQKGLRTYFERHKGQNTEISDFIGALSVGAGKDISQWSETWLTTKGVNGVTVAYGDKVKCSGAINEITFKQVKLPHANALKEQRFQAALYKDKKVIRKIEVLLNASTETKVALPSTACPDFVLINSDDTGFLRNIHSAAEILALLNQAPQLSDTKARQLVYFNIFEQVREGSIPLQSFSLLVIQALEKETDTEVLSQLSRALVGPYSLSRYLIPNWSLSAVSALETTPSSGLLASTNEMASVPEVQVAASKPTLSAGEDPIISTTRENSGMTTETNFSNRTVRKIEKVLLARLLKASPGSELQMHFFNMLTSFYQSPESAQTIIAILDGKTKLKGLALDSDRKWQLLGALARTGNHEASTRIQSHYELDKSQRGEENKLSAMASIPDLKTKKDLYSQVLKNEPPISLALQESILFNLFPPGQENLHKPVVGEFFKNLRKFNDTKPTSFLRAYAEVVPDTCSPQVRDDIDIFLKGSKAPPALTKSLRIARQEGERCELVRKASHFIK